MKKNTQTKNAEPVEGFTGGGWRIEEHINTFLIMADTPFPIAVINNKHRPTEANKANAALIAESPLYFKYMEYVQRCISKLEQPDYYFSWKKSIK